MNTVRIYLLTFLFCLGTLSLGQADELPKVRVGMVNFVGEATNYYAYKKGLFKAEGIDVIIKRNPAGVQSLKQVIRGEIDIGTVAPTPIIFAAMGRFDLPPDFHIVASILESTSLNNVVILDSQKIPHPRQLRGKRLALTPGTASEYFWHVFALANQIEPDGPVIVPMRVTEMTEAARQGSIDAAVAWTPINLDIMRAAGAHARSYSGEDIYTTSWLVVARPDYIRQHPDRVEAYLRALGKAQEVMLSQPETVAETHAQKLNKSTDELSDLYALLEFDLSLNESLIINLSQQAVWAKNNGYVSGEVPNFRNFINTDILESMRPENIRLLE
ncbi:MAG: ABC transporter substrate-binding protein [Sedimenticola sp.]|nr:ABC transporter substrate-binding protein [Sedimenticola sp.]